MGRFDKVEFKVKGKEVQEHIVWELYRLKIELDSKHPKQFMQSVRSMSNVLFNSDKYISSGKIQLDQDSLKRNIESLFIEYVILNMKVKYVYRKKEELKELIIACSEAMSEQICKIVNSR